MVPIYEQGNSMGIGHSFESFISRFIEICNNHKEKKELGFAIIFYDFGNKPIRKILKSQGGFARLDRLAGKDLSIFYLHSDKPESIEMFNSVFTKAFEIDENINYPFVLLFDVKDDEVEDVKIVVLEQNNPLFAFHELFFIIENQKEKLSTGKYQKKFVPKINKILIVKAIDFKKIAITEFVKIIFEDTYKEVYNSIFK